MIYIHRYRIPSQGNKREIMKFKILYKYSLTSIVFLLGFLLLLCQPKFIDGLCTLQNNGTYALCHHLGDIKFINTNGVNSLRVSDVRSHLNPDGFQYLRNLKHLDLSNGTLSKIQPKSFHNLHDLRSLNLSNNDLTYIEPGTLIVLKRLHSLNLSKNAFKNIPIDINKLNHLKYLDLSENNIKCDCKTLKQRDLLLRNGIEISNNTICSGLHNLNGKSFIEPDAEAVCLFDEQDRDIGMQGDQPIDDNFDGSGEGSGDSFAEIEADDIPEDDETPTHQFNVSTESIMPPIEMPLPSQSTKSTDDELFFTEEADKYSPTPPATKLIETSKESKIPIIDHTENLKDHGWTVEGSGDDDTDDPWTANGSGFEGSGIGIVPPIRWEGVESENSREETKSATVDQDTSRKQSSSTTTEAEGIFDTLYGFFWGTSAPPIESTPSNEYDLEEEQFIPAISTTQKAIEEDIILPPINKFDVKQNQDNHKENDKTFDDSKSVNVQAEVPIETTESPDASTAKQSKKGMGSYVVLAVLLGVLGALIAFAAYKGDFCRSTTKRNNNHQPNVPDLETGTELKDMTKSLLPNSNSVHPKISSTNGGKPETVPLVTSSGIPTEIKNDDESPAKYSGAMSESSVDPIKPPRKSFSPIEFRSEKTNGTNGKVLVTPQLSGAGSGEGDINESPVVHLRSVTKNALVNGNNDRDSLSSIGGDSPSSGSPSAHLSNPRLSHNLPPVSPHAQRVKITLQDNPDSVPKTPLLITRTKAGENLVKTP